jgi:hypothetical protein
LGRVRRARGIVIAYCALFAALGGCGSSAVDSASSAQHVLASGPARAERFVKIVLKLGGRLPSSFTVRVGERIMVESVSPLRAPTAGPSSVLGRAGGTEPACSSRCLWLIARRPGVASVQATPPACRVISGRVVCVATVVAFTRIYVEPARCNSGRVMIAPVSGTLASGSLQASGLSSRGRAGRRSTYPLVRFTDSDPEPHPNADLYDLFLNWGDRIPTSASIRKTNGAYQVTGSHSYCRAGTYQMSVKIEKSPGAVYHSGESVTVRLAATVAQRARSGDPVHANEIGVRIAGALGLRGLWHGSVTHPAPQLASIPGRTHHARPPA